MYLIRTRFASATEHNGARWIVTAVGAVVLPNGRKRMVVPFDYSAPDSALAAAETFTRAASASAQRVEYLGTEDNGTIYWLVRF